MNQLKLLAVCIVTLCLFNVSPANAQEQGVTSLDEIVVTGRNREESLQEVPISVSVLSETLLEDAGISDLYDLFELIPGLQYDEGADRLGARPGIRGVQSNEVSSNRVKVAAFIDGMPVLGSQGSIGFNSFQQVEVYRGPQSAAFGRSTFAGAINYITKDPTDSFEGDLSFNGSDYGTRTFEGSFGGPLTDTLGFLIQFEHEDSSAPSEYRASGNDAQNLVLGTNINQSDNTQFGAQTGDNISAKFVFEPSDTFRTSLTFGHVETFDSQNPALWLTESEKRGCFEGNGVTPVTGMQGIYIVGEIDCDWSNNHASYANHDNEQYLIDNPGLLAYLVDAAANPQDVVITMMGMTTVIPAGPAAITQDFAGQTLTVEEQILMVARAYSIPEGNRGTASERDRFTLQSEKIFDDGSALEFSYMHSEESQNRLQDRNIWYYDPDTIGIVDDGIDDNFPGLEIQWRGDPGGVDGDGYWWRGSSNGSRYIMAQPTEIEEDYAELRWVSPGEDRLRYVVGVSAYQYDYLETSYGCNQGLPQCPTEPGVAYGSLLNGIVDEFTALTRVPFIADGGILSEQAKNSAFYFNVGYDLTDRMIVSAEGRYQRDKIGGLNNETGLSAEVSTTSFLPRFAVTYNLNDDTTVYAQWSKGVNPAGINVDLLNSLYIDSIDIGVVNGLIPYGDGSDDVDLINNDTGAAAPDGLVDDYDIDTQLFSSLTGTTFRPTYDSETFQSFQEEELTNMELGFKGNLFGGRLTYAGAIYAIDWKDQLQNGNIDWDSPCADGNLRGQSPAGGAGTCLFEGTEYYWIDESQDTSLNGLGLNFGDVKIKGAELEGTFRVNRNWQIRGSASYAKAEYDSFCDIQAYNNQIWNNAQEYHDALNLVIREPNPEDVVASTCYVVDGNKVRGQPQVTGSLSPSFSTDIGGLRFQTRMDIRYEGSKFFDSLNWTKIPSVTDTNISFSLSGDAWSATLYVNNVTDENQPRSFNTSSDAEWLIATDATPVTDLLGNQVDTRSANLSFAPRLPRTVGLRVNYNF